MLPVARETRHFEFQVEAFILKGLASGFSRLYNHSSEQLAYVASHELENLKELCVWFSEVFSHDYQKAKLVSEVALCVVTLRSHFEFGSLIDNEPHVGHIKFHDSPGDSVREKIASSLLPHPGLRPIKKAEINQTLGYLGTVKVYFEALDHRPFLDVIWPIHELLDEVLGHL